MVLRGAFRLMRLPGRCCRRVDARADDELKLFHRRLL
jgi:hypothetical protein